MIATTEPTPRATAATIAETLAACQQAGLRCVSDVIALIHLSANGYTPTTALAGHIGVTGAAVTQLIDRLTERGMITRHYSTLDRRLVLAAVTDQGRQLITPLLP